MDPLSGLAIELPPTGSGRRLRALHQQLRAAILDGRLAAGLRLPSSRALAAACGVSRNTVVAAYELLLGEGYLTSRRGSGTRVADVQPAVPRAQPSAAATARLNAAWRDAPRVATGQTMAPFRLGVPDTALFPFDVWRRLSARAWRTLEKQPAAYLDPQGQESLRAAIAGHVSFARALACRADDVLVTAGAQQAFDLLARTLVTAGRTVVAMEDPGYPPARRAFAAAGARVVPVPVDAEGLVVERLPRNAQLVYVTPSHQFPLGVAMSLRRRQALLDVAQRRGMVVIEDDYDGEFGFDGRPLEALATLDRHGSVCYVGTFSKSLFPGVRLGYVVAPSWALPALTAARQCADWHGMPQAQELLAAFVAEGHLARHVRRMRRVYAERRAVLLAGLQQGFDGRLRALPSAAGLHLAAHAVPGDDMAAVADRAARLGLAVAPLSRFHAGPPAQQGLVFGYGATRADDIAAALPRLQAAWRR